MSGKARPKIVKNNRKQFINIHKSLRFVGLMECSHFLLLRLQKKNYKESLKV